MIFFLIFISLIFYHIFIFCIKVIFLKSKVSITDLKKSHNNFSSSNGLFGIKKKFESIYKINELKEYRKTKIKSKEKEKINKNIIENAINNNNYNIKFLAKFLILIYIIRRIKSNKLYFYFFKDSQISLKIKGVGESVY